MKKLRDSGKATLFDYDLSLNLYYFVSMWKQRKKILKPKELEPFHKGLWGADQYVEYSVDLQGEEVFNLSPADIYALLIPIQYKISTVLIKEMVEASDLDAFQKAVERRRTQNTLTSAKILRWRSCIRIICIICTGPTEGRIRILLLQSTPICF